MISVNTLKLLTTKMLKDAKALQVSGRNSAAIYLAGYGLEFALKRKIALTLGFISGFPETSTEFGSYNAQIAMFNAISTGIQLSKLKEIKNHDLTLLLKFSGADARITTSYYKEWLLVKDWSPENRYVIRRYSAEKVTNFIKATKTIINHIL